MIRDSLVAINITQSDKILNNSSVPLLFYWNGEQDIISSLKQDDALKKALCELVSQGGKRIRPLFLLMATDLGSYPKKEDCYLAAVAIELLHLSSLIHDDIIDHSPMRHNVLTLHERYGAKVALKLGNYTLNNTIV